ncbi:MAG TPA: hypothetical protein VK590_11095, partial [Saprospiraceae bacterium]|nr:hypothetical protein [Saprospiraceae bacterium]
MINLIRERNPNRVSGLDYSLNNIYFITSCLCNMLCHFGEIKSDVDLKDTIKQTMILNEFGKIAQGQWFWLAEQYPYVRLHEFVVMPNHIHGIIEIDQNLVMKGIQDRSKPFINIVNQVSSIKIKSISELMGAYKTTV